MNKLSEFYQRLSPAHLVFLLASVVLSMAALAATSAIAAEAPQLMFVQSADDLKVDAAKSTLRLVKVNQQTLYFSDRPQRLAGHLKMADYLKEWTAQAGKDSFKADPPNATLSVYEPGKPDSTLVVVKLTNPVVEGADLVYTYKVINGTMPANGGRETVTTHGLPVKPAQQNQTPGRDTLVSAAGVGFCCLHWNTNTFHPRWRIEEIRRLQLRLPVQYHPPSNYGAASMQSTSPSLALLRKYITSTDLESYFPGVMLPRWAVELMDEPLFDGWRYEPSQFPYYWPPPIYIPPLPQKL